MLSHVCSHMCAPTCALPCALICVLLSALICVLFYVLSYVCSHLCARICLISYVCLHMCALICLLSCALICLLLRALICVSSSSSSPPLISLVSFCLSTLFGVSCRDNLFQARQLVSETRSYRDFSFTRVMNHFRDWDRIYLIHDLSKKTSLAMARGIEVPHRIHGSRHLLPGSPWSRKCATGVLAPRHRNPSVGARKTTVFYGCNQNPARAMR